MRQLPLSRQPHFAAIGAGGGPRSPIPRLRITGPLVHENLAIYFMHGQAPAGPVPLTLQEALAKGSVQVVETGRVNELQIENTGNEEVFIQAGDIVKGGKQDRVLTVSLLLPPKSGRVPIASFCVEQGRWSPRGKEDHAKFTSATRRCPRARRCSPWRLRRASRRVRSADAECRMRPQQTATPSQRGNDDGEQAAQGLGGGGGNAEGALEQRRAAVASQQSATSLQLSLENDKLKEARAAYIKALQGAGDKDGDVVGYIVAINGKLSIANVYPSNGLFRKMWEKQLAAVVTEAIGEKAAARPPPLPSRRRRPQRPSSSTPPRRASPRSATLPPACARRCATPTSRSTTRRAAPTANGSTAATSRSSARIPGPKKSWTKSKAPGSPWRRGRGVRYWRCADESGCGRHRRRGNRIAARRPEGSSKTGGKSTEPFS